ncbi:glycoside/pentoside/hexuronide:cation symporter, GPH family [Staphylococcus caledonicus]
MKVITFGEIMMRLSPPGFGKIEDATKFDINYGGAEMNVAVGLSSLGVQTSMLTGLPSNVLGNTVLMNLRKFNINTDFIEQREGRLGTYFLEKGFSVRPFILYGTLPLAIITVITFLSPDLSHTGKIAWAFGTYMLFNLAYSVVNIPYGSLSASMTLNADDRTQLSVFRNLGSQGAIFVAGIVVVPMVNLFNSHTLGYPVVVAALAIVGVLLHLICYKNVKERHVKLEPKEKGEIREQPVKKDSGNAFAGVLKNGAFAALAIFTLLSIMALFLKQSSQLYYFQYVLNEPNFLGLVSTLNFISLIPALIFTTYLSKKLGKKMTAIIGIAGFVVCEFLNYFFFGEQHISFLTVNTFSNFFLVIPTTVSWAFIADVVEYGQWKTGKRTEGIIYSSYSFTRKLSQALAGFVPGLALTLIGYQPNVAQSAGTLEGLRILFFVIPGSISLIALIIFFFTYPLTDKRHKQIVKELTLRDEL